MVDELHLLTVESDNGIDVVYVCSQVGCGRRVAVNRSGELVVVVQGDFYAFHARTTEGLEIEIMAPEQREST